MSRVSSFDKILLFSYFLSLSLVGALLLSLPISSKEDPFHFSDALLLAVSACCVTGLSSVSADSFSLFGHIVLILLMEFGGMGIIAFFAIYIAAPARRISFVSRKMISSFFIGDSDVHPKQIIKRIIITTFLIQGIGVLVLFISFSVSGKSSSPFFDAVFHSVSAFCNAGFSTFNDSLCQFADSPAVQICIMLLVVAGGLGFSVIHDIFKCMKSFFSQRLIFNSRIVLLMTAALILTGTVLFFLIETDGLHAGLPFSQQVLNSFFHSVIPRTAGFELYPQTDFTPVSGLLTMILMFIGGAPGSMAGGIKVTTFFVMLSYAFKESMSSTSMRIFQRTINADIIEKAFNITGKAFLFLSISVLLLAMSEQRLIESGRYSLFDLMFESVSAFCTVGLSRNVTPDLSVMGKFIISCTMFIGRTGVFAMLLALPHSKRSVEYMIEYPTENIMLG